MSIEPVVLVTFSDRILLVTMYSKSDVSDISAAEVAEVLAEAEAELNDSEEVIE
jgi:hypothetical protein